MVRKNVRRRRGSGARGRLYVHLLNGATMSDREREKLASIIDNATMFHTDDIDRAADAVLSAGFHCAEMAGTDWYDTHCPTCDAPEPWHTATCAVVHIGVGEPSDAQVTAAAKAIAAYQGARYEGSLEKTWREMAHTALRSAANAA
jgi:hypothetical protein